MKKLLPLLLCILLLSGCAATYDGPTVAKTVLASTEQHYPTFEPDLTETYRTEYAYDIYGNQSIILEYHNDEPLYKIVQRYDEAGNLIRKTQYDVSGWFPREIVDNHYRYDEQGRMIGSTHSEEPEVTILYDDEAGTRTTIQDTTVIDYFDENGWVYRIEYPGTDRTEEFDRRPDGQWTAIRSYEGGTLVSTLERTYDEQGRPLTHTSIENGVSTLLFSWEYGERYERMTYSDGSSSNKVYNEDGTMYWQYRTDADGRLSEETFYYYTEIQVPAGKEDTP